MPERSRPPEIDWDETLELALTVPGNLGNTYGRVKPYSFLNYVRLYHQGVEPQPVATYNRWQELGRQVKKGSKAKEILRPITVTKRDDDGEIEGRFTRFKMVRCIFPIEDTEGQELPALEIPDYDLELAHKQLDITRVPFQTFDGNSMGYSVGREYAINPLAPYPEKTRAHEWGHIVLKHTTPEGLAEYQQHRGTFEFQAESTALLTMKELDIAHLMNESESRAYIQTWLRGSRPTAVAIKQVFSATDQIIRAGRPVATSTEEAA